MLVLMSDVTRILSQIESGDPAAAEQLLPLVYDELRKLAAARLAHEKPGQTLQATALVHEAYVRLVDVEKAQQWDGRGHFFAAAAEAMRRILVDQARRKASVKRGGALDRIELAEFAQTPDDKQLDLIALDAALTQLEQQHPENDQVIKLRLVEDHFRAGSSFLQDPAAHGIVVTADPSMTEAVGTQIRPYKLLQVIGEGGMGVVYMAEQRAPVKRRVALKIIKPGMDSKQVLARFEAERQALPMMDHPNIAKVLDAGSTDNGRPYFVMELVNLQRQNISGSRNAEVVSEWFLSVPATGPNDRVLVTLVAHTTSSRGTDFEVSVHRRLYA